MRKFVILIGVLGIFYNTHALHAQVLYKWEVRAAAGSTLYRGDISNAGKLKPAFSAALERKIAYGVSARATIEQYTLMANDRVNGSGTLTPEAENFDRSLNFKTRATYVGIQAVYSANNGYILPEDAVIAPFAFVGAGITSFQTWADQYYGPGSVYPYNYGDLEGNIRNITSGNPKLQDGVFETKITGVALEEKQLSNTAFTPVLGLGANVRISNRFSAFITTHYGITLTDNLDGISGNINPVLEPTSSEYYLANPGGLNTAIRGNASKQDRIFNGAVGISYHFGGNYYDKGPVVVAPPEDTVKGKKPKKQEAYQIDPFKENGMASGKASKPFTLKEKEEMVFFINEDGKKDTMFVMKIDTIYKNESYAVRGSEPTVPKTYESLNQNPAATVGQGGADAAMIRDIYEKLNQLTESIASIDNRVKSIENTISSSPVRTYSPSPTPETDMISSLQSVIIFFPYGKSTLEAENTEKLKTIADILKQYPSVGVALNAFADPSGNPSMNMKLSQDRASSVRKYLTGLGVKSYQMIAQYHGAEGDIGKADPERRRVEIEFIKVR